MAGPVRLLRRLKGVDGGTGIRFHVRIWKPNSESVACFVDMPCRTGDDLKQWPQNGRASRRKTG